LFFFFLPRPIKPWTSAAKGPFSFVNNQIWDQPFQYPHHGQFAAVQNQDADLGLYQSSSQLQCSLNQDDQSKQAAKSLGNFPQYHSTSIWNSYGNFYHNSVAQCSDHQNTKLFHGQHSYQGYQSGYNNFSLHERSASSSSPLMFSPMTSAATATATIIKSENPETPASQSKKSKRCKCPNCTTSDNLQVAIFP